VNFATSAFQPMVVRKGLVTLHSSAIVTSTGAGNTAKLISMLAKKNPVPMEASAKIFTGILHAPVYQDIQVSFGFKIYVHMFVDFFKNNVICSFL
jgi:type III secretion system FlhB-like substrate exporter